MPSHFRKSESSPSRRAYPRRGRKLTRPEDEPAAEKVREDLRGMVGKGPILLIKDFAAQQLRGPVFNLWTSAKVHLSAESDLPYNRAMAKEVPLKGKTALVTGAASGIGRQVAWDLFSREGCRLILVDRNQNGIEQLAEQLLGQSSRKDNSMTIETIACDVSLTQEMDKLQHITTLDILVNNAGLTFNGTFESSQIEDFQRLLDTNLMGPVRVTKTLLPALLKGSSPTIVNLASLAGLIGAPGMCPYSTSKFGLIGFSEALSAELHGRVFVSMVCPSFVKTEIAHHASFSSSASDKDKKEFIAQMDDIIRKFGSSTQKVSRKIIRGIKRRERLVVINPEANVLYFLKRVAPSLTDSVVSKAYGKL
ncbi:MAG: SDR family oxidoreductase, partial [Bdellovibrionales bacterium]|nr:SDR family oxidoreductase [Bdellovibrionales bacterium]